MTFQKVLDQPFPRGSEVRHQQAASRFRTLLQFLGQTLPKDVAWLLCEHPMLKDLDWPVLRHPPFCLPAFDRWVEDVVKPHYDEVHRAGAIADDRVKDVQDEVRSLARSLALSRDDQSSGQTAPSTLCAHQALLLPEGD